MRAGIFHTVIMGSFFFLMMYLYLKLLLKESKTWTIVLESCTSM